MTKITFDFLAKINRILYIRAMAISEETKPIEIIGVNCEGKTSFITRFSDSPFGKGQNRFLKIYVVADANFLPSETTLIVTVRGSNEVETLRYDYDAIRRASIQLAFTVNKTWNELIQSPKIKNILDIGGRARSGISRKDSIPGKKIYVVDIIATPDVDYVVYCHEMSSKLKKKFDAFMSLACFEHLLMPRKAAGEISKVLNDGTVGLVVTCQTVGVHDAPWDFFQFSDSSWKAIFNKFTGFEIVDAGMALPVMIVPKQWWPHLEGTEHHIGYKTSSVVVRKNGPPLLDWNAPLKEITGDMCPQ